MKVYKNNKKLPEGVKKMFSYEKGRKIKIVRTNTKKNNSK